MINRKTSQTPSRRRRCMVTRHMYFAESTDTYGIAFLELPNYNIKKYELLYPCFFYVGAQVLKPIPFYITFWYYYTAKKSIVNYFCKNSVIILENLSYIFLFCYNRKNHFDFINIFWIHQFPRYFSVPNRFLLYRAEFFLIFFPAL